MGYSCGGTETGEGDVCMVLTRGYSMRCMMIHYDGTNVGYDAMRIKLRVWPACYSTNVWYGLSRIRLRYSAPR
eukprot:2107567-Rhodomonas_salina.1